MSGLRSLTREEAEERAGLLSVDRYDIAIDMTELPDGEAFRAVSTVRYTDRFLWPADEIIVAFRRRLSGATRDIP